MGQNWMSHHQIPRQDGDQTERCDGNLPFASGFSPCTRQAATSGWRRVRTERVGKVRNSSMGDLLRKELVATYSNTLVHAGSEHGRLFLRTPIVGVALTDLNFQNSVGRRSARGRGEVDPKV